MKRLDFVRADRLSQSQLNRKRKNRADSTGVEHLEKRSLLSATVVSQVPTQNLTAGEVGTIVSLGTYLNDPAVSAGGTVIQMATPLGNIPLVLTDARTPLTVANFLKYVNNGDYVPTIIQRSSPGFVIQGGGTKPDGSSNPSLGNVQSESGVSNTTGTIAMALSTGPNSGNNQWFINLGNNAILDGTSDGGPFTVFGNVIDGGLKVATAISQLQIINGSAVNPNWYIGTNDGLPVINYTGSTMPTSVPQANLVTDAVSVLSAAQAAPTYTAVSANPALVTASVNAGVLTLSPVSPTASGTTTVTATVTDLGGETATSTFTVNISGLPTVAVANASGNAGSGNQVIFPITLSSATSTATTFSYLLTAGTAPSTDFAATGSTTVTIPAGSTHVNIPVNILGDSTGTVETFTITLSGLTAGVEFPGGVATVAATGTIQPAAAEGSTTTLVTVSSPAVGFGGTDTITAAVSPALVSSTVTGTVTFFVNAAAVGTVAVSGNGASLAVNLNNAGNQTITAVYNGDASNSASNSNAVTVAVGDPSIVGVTVTKSTLLTTGIAGQPSKGALTVSMFNANLVVPQSGPLTLKVYATSNGIITPDSVLFGSITKKLTIKPGASANLSLPIKSLPSGLTTGNYTLVAQVTDAAGLLTVPGSVSVFAATTPVIALAETISKLVLPSAVVAGSKSPVATTLKITNSGNVVSTGVTPISLYASTDGTVVNGTLIKTVSRKLTIKPGKSISVSVPFGAYPLVADGDYLIVAQVTDPVLQVTTVKSTTTVNIAAAKIDLAASALAVPATVSSAKPLSVALTLVNNGNVVASGTLQIALAASTTADGSSPFSLGTLTTHIKLQPGKSQVVHLKLKLPAGSPTGQQFVIATIDPAPAFADIVLSNNAVVSTNASSFI